MDDQKKDVEPASNAIKIIPGKQITSFKVHGEQVVLDDGQVVLDDGREKEIINLHTEIEHLRTAIKFVESCISDWEEMSCPPTPAMIHKVRNVLTATLENAPRPEQKEDVA